MVNNYRNKGHNESECMGFVDGMNAMFELVSNKDAIKIDKRYYRQSFLDWMEKYFVYDPITYGYKSKHNKTRHTLGMLRKDYKKAMLESAFN